MAVNRKTVATVRKRISDPSSRQKKTGYHPALLAEADRKIDHAGLV